MNALQNASNVTKNNNAFANMLQYMQLSSETPTNVIRKIKSHHRDG